MFMGISGELEMKAKAFKEKYNACVKEATKFAIDSIDISSLDAEDNESMTTMKLILQALELCNDALDLQIDTSAKLDHTYELLEKLVANTERLENRLANIEHSQRQIDTRIDGLEEAIRTSGKVKTDK